MIFLYQSHLSQHVSFSQLSRCSSSLVGHFSVSFSSVGLVSSDVFIGLTQLSIRLSILSCIFHVSVAFIRLYLTVSSHPIPQSHSVRFLIMSDHFRLSHFDVRFLVLYS